MRPIALVKCRKGRICSGATSRDCGALNWDRHARPAPPVWVAFAPAWRLVTLQS
jgi:hypothetical protein